MNGKAVSDARDGGGKGDVAGVSARRRDGTTLEAGFDGSRRVERRGPAGGRAHLAGHLGADVELVVIADTAGEDICGWRFVGRRVSDRRARANSRLG